MVKGLILYEMNSHISTFLNNIIIYIYILCTALAVLGYIRQHPCLLLRALSTGVEYTSTF